MEIMKHGDPELIEHIHDIFTFKCRVCGCEFKAGSSDYTKDTLLFLHCNCPDCGFEIIRTSV